MSLLFRCPKYDLVFGNKSALSIGTRLEISIPSDLSLWCYIQRWFICDKDDDPGSHYLLQVYYDDDTFNVNSQI